MTSNPSRTSVAVVAVVELSDHSACGIHVVSLVRAFAAAGHPTTLLAPRPVSDPAVNPHGNNVTVRYTRPGPSMRLPYSAGFLLLLPRLLREARDGRADIVYMRAGMLSWVVSAVLRVLTSSYVITEHNGWYVEEMRSLGRSPAMVEVGRLMQLLDAYLAHAVGSVTEGIGDALVRHGVPRRKVFVAGNGTSVAAVRPLDRTAALGRMGLDPARRYVGFIGNLAPWQGVSQIVEAMACLIEHDPHVDALIAGSGPEREALAAQVRAAGLEDRVRFLGHVRLQDVNTVLACFDVAVVSAAGRKSEFGLSPLKLRDYAAAGRAVVGADVPGIRELADHGWLDLYPPPDSGELAKRLAALLADDRRREEMGVRARQYAEQHFDWRSIAAVILSRFPVDR